ncbi:MAG TPA: hypothetical protein VN442_21740 [Bryobacteraceae bacterium]|nr:hypothetical protein [Bryobacteraceae bacterium]
MLARALDLLFGCRHANQSRPWTLPDAKGITRSYTVCLECGKHVPYSLVPVEPAALRVGELQEEI